MVRLLEKDTTRTLLRTGWTSQWTAVPRTPRRRRPLEFARTQPLSQPATVMMAALNLDSHCPEISQWKESIRPLSRAATMSHNYGTTQSSPRPHPRLASVGPQKERDAGPLTVLKPGPVPAPLTPCLGKPQPTGETATLAPPGAF